VPSDVTHDLDRDDYGEELARLWGGFVQLTRHKVPSGVAVPEAPSWDLRQGDVIRAVDGLPTTTVKAVTHALEAARKRGKVAVKLQRGDGRFTLRLNLRDSPLTLADSGEAGFRLYPIHPASPWEALGFVEDDVLLAVDRSRPPVDRRRGPLPDAHGVVGAVGAGQHSFAGPGPVGVRSSR
jgi:hypothetical protein